MHCLELNTTRRFISWPKKYQSRYIITVSIKLFSFSRRHFFWVPHFNSQLSPLYCENVTCWCERQLIVSWKGKAVHVQVKWSWTSWGYWFKKSLLIRPHDFFYFLQICTWHDTNLFWFVYKMGLICDAGPSRPVRALRLCFLLELNAAVWGLMYDYWCQESIVPRLKVCHTETFEKILTYQRKKPNSLCWFIHVIFPFLNLSTLLEFALLFIVAFNVSTVLCHFT